jgi:hypothetical protein
MIGATWAPGPAGLPAAVAPAIALVGRPIAFGTRAKRNIRWDPRR